MVWSSQRLVGDEIHIRAGKEQVRARDVEDEDAAKEAREGGEIHGRGLCWPGRRLAGSGCS